MKRGGIDCGSGSAQFCRERQFAPSNCAPGSTRTVKSGRARVITCCPRGHYRRGRCLVAIKAQSILRPKSHPKCNVCRVRSK